MVKKKIKEKVKRTSKSKISKKIDEDEIEAESMYGENKKELEHGLDDVEKEIKKLGSIISDISSEDVVNRVEIKGTKPISQLKKGDKIKVDGVEMQVDTHYVLMDHGRTKEMTIEVFNPKTDKDFQLRYFSDQVETSMEFYELQEIVYVRRPCKRVEW